MRWCAATCREMVRGSRGVSCPLIAKGIVFVLGGSESTNQVNLYALNATTGANRSTKKNESMTRSTLEQVARPPHGRKSDIKRSAIVVGNGVPGQVDGNPTYRPASSTQSSKTLQIKRLGLHLHSRRRREKMICPEQLSAKTVTAIEIGSQLRG